MSDYFTELKEGAEQLDALAEVYMEDKEFLPNDAVMDRIWEACLRLFKKHGGYYDGGHLRFDRLDWDRLPWWAAQTLDGWMPYSSVPRNGSLGFALGYSPASMDAHLRNILEIAEGREHRELDFPITYKGQKNRKTCKN